MTCTYYGVYSVYTKTLIKTLMRTTSILLILIPGGHQDENDNITNITACTKQQTIHGGYLL